MKAKGGMYQIAIEHIENWLLNRGYRLQPARPLYFTQIVYLAWEVWGIKFTRNTLMKHYKQCMGSPPRKVPPAVEQRQNNNNYIT